MTYKASSPNRDYSQGRRVNATIAEVTRSTVEVYRPVLAGSEGARTIPLIQGYVTAVLGERGYDMSLATMFAVDSLKVALRPPIVTGSGSVQYAARSIGDEYSATYAGLEDRQPSVYRNLESVTPAKGIVSLARQGSAAVYLFMHPRLKSEQQAINDVLGVAGDGVYVPGLTIGTFPRVDARTADTLAEGLTEISKLATVDLGPVTLDID